MREVPAQHMQALLEAERLEKNGQMKFYTEEEFDVIMEEFVNDSVKEAV